MGQLRRYLLLGELVFGEDKFKALRRYVEIDDELAGLPGGRHNPQNATKRKQLSDEMKAIFLNPDSETERLRLVNSLNEAINSGDFEKHVTKFARELAESYVAVHPEGPTSVKNFLTPIDLKKEFANFAVRHPIRIGLVGDDNRCSIEAAELFKVMLKINDESVQTQADLLKSLFGMGFMKRNMER